MRYSIVLPLTCLTLVGCGDGLEKFSTTGVTGQVLCEGKPVPGAYVSFGPMSATKSMNAGKQAVGTAAQDGTFVLSTYGKEDGAVVGKHRIRVSSPHPEDFPDFTCNCETDGNKVLKEVDVTAGGENRFTIELPLKTAKSNPNVSADDLEDIRAGNEAEQEAARKTAPQ